MVDKSLLIYNSDKNPTVLIRNIKRELYCGLCKASFRFLTVKGHKVDHLSTPSHADTLVD